MVDLVQGVIETNMKVQVDHGIHDQVPIGLYKEGQQVELLIKSTTDLGYKAIVDGKYWGVLFYNEVFQELEKNQLVIGFIKQVRPDHRLDLTLYKTGTNDAEEMGELILAELRESKGFLPIDSKTPPEEIYQIFGISKKKFKIALGGLYKKRIVEVKEDGIYLNSMQS